MRENDGRKLNHRMLEQVRMRVVRQIEDGARPEYVAEARFDAREAARTVASLSALSLDKGVGIRLAVKDGSVTLAVLEDRGQATIEAEASGEMETAINSRLFRDALKALGGMAEVKLTGDATAPILFTADGYMAMVMPVQLPARPQAEGEAQAVEDTPTDGETPTDEETPTQAEGEPQAQDTQAEGDPSQVKDRRRRRAREPVAA